MREAPEIRPEPEFVLNGTSAPGIILTVTWLMKCIAALLLALWVPVTMHCALELVPGLGFIQTCCGEQEAQPADHDCSQDLCSAIESGFYKVDDYPALAPSQALLLAFTVWNLSAELPAITPPLSPPAPSPPELPRSWQFSHRTALPPRAPSAVA